MQVPNIKYGADQATFEQSVQAFESARDANRRKIEAAEREQREIARRRAAESGQ
jgi:hypothetical protein